MTLIILTLEVFLSRVRMMGKPHADTRMCWVGLFRQQSRGIDDLNRRERCDRRANHFSGHSDKEPLRLVIPARLLQTSGAWECDTAEHIVRWIRVDEGGIGIDGKMGGCDRERRIIGNE